MLSTSSTVKLFFDDDEWNATPQMQQSLYKPTITSWGVTSIGRGFDWNSLQEQKSSATTSTVAGEYTENQLANPGPQETELQKAVTHLHKQHHTSRGLSLVILPKPLTMAPPSSPQDVHPPYRSNTPIIQPLIRTPSSPKPKRRSSQQRVSLIAGQVLISPIEPPTAPSMLSENLRRTPSNRSFLSQAESTGAPTPSSEPESFLGEKNISEYLIDGEIGRGAYGLVKRAREMHPDGSLGVSLIFIGTIVSYRSWITSAAAPTGNQTSDKVAYIGGLLEEASEVWHYTHRDLCPVCDLEYFICSATSATLGPFSLFSLVRSAGGCNQGRFFSRRHRERLDRRQSDQRSPKYMPLARFLRG